MKIIVSKLILVSCFTTNVFAKGEVSGDLYVDEDLRKNTPAAIKIAIRNNDLDTLDNLLSDLSSKKDTYLFGDTNNRPKAFYAEITQALNDKNEPLLKLFLKYEKQNPSVDGFLFDTFKGFASKVDSDIWYMLWKNGAEDKHGCNEYATCYIDHNLLYVALRDKNFKMVNDLFQHLNYKAFLLPFTAAKYNMSEGIELLNMLSEHRSEIAGFEDFLKKEASCERNPVAHKIFFPEAPGFLSGYIDYMTGYMDYMMGLPGELTSKALNKLFRKIP